MENRQKSQQQDGPLSTQKMEWNGAPFKIAEDKWGSPF